MSASCKRTLVDDVSLLFDTFPLAYVEQHHQLPNDKWSSDIECEQRPSPGEQSCKMYLTFCPAFCSVITVEEDLPQVEKLSLSVMPYNCHLQSMYEEPQVLMKDFVNVLCTEGTDEPDERRTKQLKRGLVERVEQTITPMQLSDKARMREGCMPKCIVVHGAPGSRKIMFSWESQKEILTTSMLGNEAIVRTVD